MKQPNKITIYLTLNILIVSLYALAGPIPDTGITKCYNDTEEIPCPQPGEPFYGQDGNYIINPPSYTKLDAQGNDLPDSATEWVMVRDNVTGLIWEVKTDDGSVHDKDNKYTWYDPNDETNGGNPGTPGDGTDTEDFIAALNESNFGGFNDWRLPTIKEWSSIIDNGITSNKIDKNYFPNNMRTNYFSSTTSTSNSAKAGYAEFSHGYISYINKSYNQYVRAVRCERSRRFDSLIMNGDDTITDIKTGMMWQIQTSRFSWKEAISFCENLMIAGYSDWRLPNIDELFSIVDPTRNYPSINPDYFYDTKSSFYWSSSTYYDGRVWGVLFDEGYFYYNSQMYSNKSDEFNVKAVRGGQNRIPGHLIIEKPEQASRWVIGDSLKFIWETKDINTNLQISLSRHGGKEGTFETIAENINNEGQYTWTVTGPSSFNCILKIEAVDGLDISTTQGLFSIGSSNHGWIIFSQKESNQYRFFLDNFSEDGIDLSMIEWLSSNSEIASIDNNILSAHMNGWVEVSTEYLQNTYKKNLFIDTNQKTMQSARWHIGSNQTITWNTQSISGNVRILLTRFSQQEEIIAESTENDGVYTWTVSAPESFNCLLNIIPVSGEGKKICQGLFSICELKSNWIHAEPNMYRTDRYQLSLDEIYSDGFSPLDVQWTCSNTDIATIDNHILSGLKNGWVKISTEYREIYYQKWLPVYISRDIMEMEPNNIKDKASVMEDGIIYTGGFYENDLDYYQFTLLSNAMVDFFYFSHSIFSTNMTVKIFDANNVLIYSKKSFSGESLFFSLGLIAGTYYIQVSPNGDVDQLSDYMISYKVSDTLQARTSVPLVIGDDVVQSTINSLVDACHFSYSINEKQSVQVEFTPHESLNNLAKYCITIIDQNQNVLDQMKSMNRTPVSIETTYSTGIYSIIVTPFEDVDANMPFTLSLKQGSSYVEEEPNNRIDQAADIDVETSMKGRISSNSDIDYYTFLLKQPQNFEILFSCPEGGQDYSLTLYKDAHENMIDSMLSIKGQEISFKVGLDMATYFLKVSSDNAIPENLDYYNFQIKPSNQSFEMETNNSLHEATNISVGSSIKGRVSTYDDIDYFNLKLDSPTYITLNFSCIENSISYRLFLYKETEENLIESSSSINGEQIAFDLGLSAGKYYLKVIGIDDVPFNSNSDYYTLTIAKSSQTNMEIESNNTLKFANAIENDSPKLGRIYSSSDVDYYGFYLDMQSIFSVYLDAYGFFKPTVGDYKVSLMDENDEMIELRTSTDGLFIRLHSQQKPGNYYIKIESNGDIDQNQVYSLSISSTASIIGLKQLVSLTLNGSKNEMLIGESQNLTVTASYSDVNSEHISHPIWNTLNSQVATVDASGKVSAMSEGTTAIVATYGGLAGQFPLSIGTPEIIYSQHHGNLILVAGGGIEASNTLKESTQYLCDMIYSRFKERLFTDEDIYYFNPLPWHDLDGDGYGENIIDDVSPTVNEFGKVITEWAPAQTTDGPLFIYLVDHGEIDKFKIFPFQVLSASDLNHFLNTFQNETNRDVVLLIEACKSGSFTDDIESTANRVVITSTDNRNAYLEMNGRISFTQFIMDNLYSGSSLNKAFMFAKNQLKNIGLPYSRMAPQLPTDMFALAETIHIGGNFAIADLYPEILEISPNQTVTANASHSFYVKLAGMVSIKRVWAVVIPPGYTPPEITNDFEAPEVRLPIFDLTRTDQENHFEGTYDDFRYNDIYRIIFYASNEKGNVSVSQMIEVTVQGGSALDSDGDGMPNDWENLYSDLNKDVKDGSEDPDQDGLTNLQEYLHSANPTKSDTDHDNMPDGWEVNWGFNPLENDGDLDADEDGVSNAIEFQDQTNPINNSSFLDHILPKVISTTPASGDVNIQQDTFINIEFSEPMNADLLSINHISINGTITNLFQGKLSYDAVRHVLTIIPENYFDFGETITVKLKNTLTDIAGNPLDGNENGQIDTVPTDDYTWSFEIVKSPEIVPPNPYDSNEDWAISDFELLYAIDEWAIDRMLEQMKDDCDIDFYLLNLIDLWKGDLYGYDQENWEGCFPWRLIE
jgi:hypothetical protein